MTRIQLFGFGMDLTQEGLKEARVKATSSGRNFYLPFEVGKKPSLELTYNDLLSGILDADKVDLKDKVPLLQTVVQLRGKGYEGDYDKTWTLVQKIELALRRAWGAMRQAWLVHRAESFIEKNSSRNAGEVTKKNSLELTTIIEHSPASASVTSRIDFSPLMQAIQHKVNLYFIYSTTQINPAHFLRFQNKCSNKQPLVVVTISNPSQDPAAVLSHMNSVHFMLGYNPDVSFYRLRVDSNNVIDLTESNNADEVNELNDYCSSYYALI